MAAATVCIDPAALVDATAAGLARIEGKPFATIAGPQSVVDLVLPEPVGPLHYTMVLTALCADICARVPEFRHIDMSRILLALTNDRNRKLHGYQARLTPLRFPGGGKMGIRRGRPYRIQEFRLGDCELFHLLAIYVPRFWNQSFDEKLITIFHELYHVSPDVPGDLRRLPGSQRHHGPSQRDFDRQMADFARHYLATRPSRRRIDFLRLDEAQLMARYGAVVGVRAALPKLLPIAANSASR